MNAEQLLNHYERIVDSPDAVTRLRQLVLDLAVRGMLVRQSQKDAPASQLLDEVARRTGKAAIIDQLKEPFALPNGWVWSTVGRLSTKTGSGSTPRGGKAVYKKEGVPFLRSQNVHNDGLRMDDVAYIDRATHKKMSGTAVLTGDLLLNITGGSIGRCCHIARSNFEANISQHVAIIRAAVSEMAPFIHIVVLSRYFQSYVIGEQTGAGRGGLPKNRMDKIGVPVPPLSEQLRILARVDELMALCDQLETSRTERESTRDRLAVASFSRLDAPDSETFVADARIALDTLPSLTTRIDQIKLFRQTIFNLAVRGKLLPQNPNDEPASALLERIKSRKMIIGGRPDTQIRGDTIYVPPGWCTATMGEYAVDVFTGPFGSAIHQHDYVDGGVPLINPSHMKNDRIVPDARVSVSEAVAKRLASYALQAGDIVMARRGEVGRAALVEVHQSGWLCGTGSFFLRFTEEVNRRFLLLLLRTSPIRGFLAGEAVGTTMVNLNHNILKRCPLSIPPLLEQQRIVAKVDELMTLCDQLEASLTNADETRRSLLDALLHETLAPVSKPSKEHARAAVSGYLVSRLASKRNFGRTAHMKHLYFAESFLGLDLGGRYMREAAGPLDTGIYELEKWAEAAGWYTHGVETLPSGNEKVSYQPGKALKAIAEEGITVLGRSRAKMDRLIDLMGGLKTESVEIIATLFAAWNDALLDGHIPDDDWIIKEVREHWHVSKQRFTPADLKEWLGWMRQNSVVPIGHPPRTMQQIKMEF